MAIGDALGAPAQSLKPGRIVQAFGKIMDYIEPDKAFEPTSSHWRLKGLYSLPTQQALVVAESLITSSKYDLQDIFTTFQAMARGEEPLGYFRGADVHFRKVLDLMGTSAAPFECGVSHPGIGAASRVLPLALIFRNDETALMRAAVECALLTHNDPRAIAGAAAIVYAAFRFSQERQITPKDRIDFCRDLQRFTRKSEEFLQDEFKRCIPKEIPQPAFYAVSDALSILLPCLRENDCALARKTIIAEANRRDPQFPISSPNQDFAPSAIVHALYISLSALTFGQGVIEIINEGKEACAMGAIAGGLLGLRFGDDGIPDEWRAGLLNAHEIARRGDEMANGFPDWSERTDLIAMESRLTRDDAAERRKRREAVIHEEEKRAQKSAARGKTAASSETKAKLPPQEEAPFAPPPWIVFGEPLADPITKQRDKALRGRKRIEWKETRRRKSKE
ncbi:MAG: ADP-ribosyl-(dinitrogen reductase) glycohydrolase [candidate division BRC1 bacterium ADurb.Bin183]|nr:MAG: ADP-ribosyl-(dinitrogen reductase) glycohydrolase [candidate division BRC1 bacterium ADurb.Bin183]